jgi:hypothetical protein
LVHRGKDMVGGNLGWIIAGGAVLAGGYLLLSKAVMKR